MTFSIGLADNPAESTSNTVVMNLTPLVASWRHCTRDIGGCWQGEGEIFGNADELQSFFLQHLGKRILVSGGGHIYWEGQIVRMELTKNGQTFVRSMENMTNRVKVLYSKIGDNLLTNGNVESASWDAVSTPQTIATCNNWYAAGSTSMYCEADGANVGMCCCNTTMASLQAYDCSMITNVASGPWTLQVVASTNDIIAQRETAGCGRTWLQCQVPDTNQHKAAVVRIISSHDGDEIYADSAILRSSPVRSETKWWVDDDSFNAYRRLETVYLEREMTDDEADGFAQRKLAENAWPRTKPSEQGSTLTTDAPQDDGLIITCMGMIWRLGMLHSNIDGTDTASNHIAALLDESIFYNSTDASIETNSAEVYIESGDPTTIWREIEKIIKRGDDSGNSWAGGAYPNFWFRYGQRKTGTQYQFVNGRMEWYGGGIIPPLEFMPGWCLMIDMPVEPTPAGGSTDDDPRRVWLAETWFVYENGETRLEWRREEDEL